MRPKTTRAIYVGEAAHHTSRPVPPTPEDQFNALPGMMQVILSFLRQDDAEDQIKANPEIEKILDDLYPRLLRFNDLLDFVTAGRRGKKYGLSERDFWQLVVAQDFECQVCHIEFKPAGPRMNVDHNHDSGEVRGILCNSCNAGLGFFRDDPARLAGALEYLAERGHYGPPEGTA